MGRVLDSSLSKSISLLAKKIDLPLKVKIFAVDEMYDEERYGYGPYCFYDEKLLSLPLSFFLDWKEISLIDIKIILLHEYGHFLFSQDDDYIKTFAKQSEKLNTFYSFGLDEITYAYAYALLPVERMATGKGGLSIQDIHRVYYHQYGTKISLPEWLVRYCYS